MSTSEINETSSWRSLSWITEKFGLFLAPLIGYYLVFSYEEAYCKAFGVPSDFIHLDVTRILIYTSILTGLVFIIYSFFDSCVKVVRTDKAPSGYDHFIRVYGPFILIQAVLFLIYGDHWKKFIIYPISIIGIFLLDVIFARKSSKQNYWHKLEGPSSLLTANRGWLYAKERLGVEWTTLIFAVFLGRVFSMELGEGRALNQRSFLMPSTIRDSIVVGIYGDKIICVQVDMQTKKLTHHLSILTAGANQPLYFDTHELGVLSLSTTAPGAKN